jgi:hypothetical protein
VKSIATLHILKKIYFGNREGELSGNGSQVIGPDYTNGIQISGKKYFQSLQPKKSL